MVLPRPTDEPTEGNISHTGSNSLDGNAPSNLMDQRHINVPYIDSNSALRGYSPTATVFSGPAMMNKNSVNMYPPPSLQSGPPGQWLQPVSGFSRPPFPAYVSGFPGSSPMPIQTRPPSVSLPDVQPPGVSSVASVNGSIAPSMVVQSFPNSVPGSSLPVTDEAPKKEKVDVWTVHRTETGIAYYYNAVTGQSTYEKPPGFKEELDKSKPVSWERLANTNWMLVHMNDGRKYYYNAVTKLSSWQIPTEVTELRKVQDSQALKATTVSVVTTNVVTEKGSDLSLSTPAVNTGGRDAMAARSSVISGASSALDLIKRKLQDAGSIDSSSPVASLTGVVASEVNGRKSTEGALKNLQNENSKDKNKDGDGDADLSNSSSDSEEEGDERSTKEECVLKFKEMLKERGVAPFSKWDKELPKIVFDPRFKAIKDHGTRRALFEHYVRTRAEEERKEKRAAQKAALEGFKNLLEEVKEDIDHNTDYQTFKKRWGEDPRFMALERKEKEILLNERVSVLKKAVEERMQAARADFRSMLQDNKDLTIHSRWSKVKESLKSDPRYKSVRHEDREKLFNQYIDELKAAEEKAKKTRAIEDQEDKLKERERALLKRKEREEQEVERVRQKARRKEAVESYQALLVETIKDPQSSWTESKLKLEKDPQGRCMNPHLDKSDMEKLFREHVRTLYERCVAEFRSLLTETITEAAAQETVDGKTCLTSWSTAKQLLKNDARYEKMPRKEREIFWRRHAEEIQRKQKKADDQENKAEDGPVDAAAKHSRRVHERR